MSGEVWDYVAGVFRRLRGDSSGRAVTRPEGQYLVTPPTLADEEYHHLTLTQDAKLRVDDPTTQGKVDDIEAKLDSATYGLAALKALIDVAQADLDNPDQYKADVSALALEATLTAIKGAGWSTETLKAIKDTLDALPAERGTDSAMLAADGALEATLTAIKGTGWSDETLKRIFRFIDFHTRIQKWDVSTAVYLQLFSIAAQETSPQGLFFKPDGTKMYVIGSTGDDVNEYDLGTPWDVSTAVYLQLFSVAAQELEPRGVFFKPDGTKMYVIGSTGDDVNEYDLGTPWDVSTAVYLQLFSVAAQELEPRGVFFKPDGTKMYVIGTTGDDVNEYDLSTPWNVSTAVYLQLFSIAAQETSPQGLFFKPDGTKMYVLGSTGQDVNEYDLGTPWNVSTAVYLQLFSVAAQEISPTGLFFKPDGTKMYVIGFTGDDVNEYDIGIPIA